MQLATYRQFFNFKRLFLAYSIPNRSYNSHILYSQHEDIDIPKVTIPEFVFEKFDQYPNKISLECAISGKKYTFDDVRKKSQNVAKNFMKLLKLTKGDVIAIILPNVPEFPICMLGALQAGIVTTTINPFFTPGEIARQLNDSNGKVVITSATTYASVYVAIKLTHKIIPAIVAKTKETETLPEGAINLHEFIDVESEIDIERNIQADDLAVLPYSSGTTGLPKGVLLSHHNIVASLSQITCKAVEHWITPTAIKDNVVPVIMPMFHIYGFSTILFAQFRLLSRIVCAPKFTPELFLDILKKHKPNVLYIVPQIGMLYFLTSDLLINLDTVSFMSDHPSMKSEFFDSILSISSGGATLGRLDEEKLLNKAQKDINIMQGYGLTEASPGVCMVVPKKKKKLGFSGSVGELFPNTCAKLIATNGEYKEIVGPNQLGELLIRGPQITRGYLNRVKETNEAFLDGWFRTGDEVYYDNNEMFYVNDRVKELIKVSGFQVAPAELEAVIRGYKDVYEVCVIGIPDKRCGEVPRAYVVPKPNSRINIEELQHYVSSKLVRYKHLMGGVVVVNDLPKNASGKIVRNELKLQYQSQTKGHSI